MMDAKTSRQNILVWEGDVVDGYTILEVLYGGGQTIYFEAMDADEHRVALKIPTRDAMNPELQGRFSREVEILKKLNAPHFPTLLAHGQFSLADVKDIPYIVTELPIGQSLDRLIAQNRARKVKPAEADARKLLHNLAVALADLQKLGIMHRAIRPQRIAVTPDYQIQILDFVLGRGVAITGDTLTVKASPSMDPTMYIAPEQLLDPRTVDNRADLFSVGVVVYEFLALSTPFGGSSARLVDELKPITQFRADVSAGMESTLRRLLQRNPADRYATAQDLLAD
ncbi:MAG: serine/threonine protein kinase, partial [Candidatus Xenobia bacterium]